MDELITLREAAELVGVSRPTLFRAVQREQLKSKVEQVGKVRCILVSKADLQEWACAREQGELPREQGSSEQREQSGLIPEQVPLVAHLDLVRLCEDTQVRLLEQMEKAHRAERQLDRVMMQIHSYQIALTDQSESLAEKSALDMQVAALQAQLEEQSRALAEENARRLAEFEAEKGELTLKLRAATSRVDWLEKRVPGWVRKMFGAK